MEYRVYLDNKKSNEFWNIVDAITFVKNSKIKRQAEIYDLEKNKVAWRMVIDERTNLG